MSIKNPININDDTPITALIVRDAMVTCFFEAHCKDSGIGTDGSEADTNKEYCKSIIKKTFSDVEGNFDKPNKKDLLKVMEKLAGFSQNFRDKSIIEKHSKEIQGLIDRL